MAVNRLDGADRKVCGRLAKALRGKHMNTQGGSWTRKEVGDHVNNSDGEWRQHENGVTQPYYSWVATHDHTDAATGHTVRYTGLLWVVCSAGSARLKFHFNSESPDAFRGESIMEVVNKYVNLGIWPRKKCVVVLPTNSPDLKAAELAGLTLVRKNCEAEKRPRSNRRRYSNVYTADPEGPRSVRGPSPAGR